MKPYNSSEASEKEVGYFPPGVWGCPPDIKISPRMGGYGIDRGYFSNILSYTNLFST
jgi:hypothetical protein